MASYCKLAKKIQRIDFLSLVVREGHYLIWFWKFNVFHRCFLLLVVFRLKFVILYKISWKVLQTTADFTNKISINFNSNSNFSFSEYFDPIVRLNAQIKQFFHKLLFFRLKIAFIFNAWKITLDSFNYILQRNLSWNFCKDKSNRIQKFVFDIRKVCKAIQKQVQYFVCFLDVTAESWVIKKQDDFHILNFGENSVMKVSVWKNSVDTKAIFLSRVINQINWCWALKKTTLKLVGNLSFRMHFGSNSGIRSFVSLSRKTVVYSVIFIKICLKGMTSKMMRISGFSMFSDTEYDDSILHKIQEGKVTCFKELEESLGCFAIVMLKWLVFLFFHQKRQLKSIYFCLDIIYEWQNKLNK